MLSLIRKVIYIKELLINSILDDFKIIGREKPKKVIVKCLICGRVQILSSIPALKKRVNTHDNICSKLILKEYHGKNNEDIKQFYSIWCNLRNRTDNKNYEKWNRYGGRGINSEEFSSFVKFYDKMFNSYVEHINIFGKENTTIERIDNDGNYSYDNCIWKTWKEQANNKSNLLEFKAINPSGIIYYGKNLKLFCEEHSLNYNTIYQGILQNNKSWKNHWFFEKV